MEKKAEFIEALLTAVHKTALVHKPQSKKSLYLGLIDWSKCSVQEATQRDIENTAVWYKDDIPTTTPVAKDVLQKAYGVFTLRYTSPVEENCTQPQLVALVCVMPLMVDDVPAIEITHLSVAPKWRRRGFGTTLLQHVVQAIGTALASVNLQSLHVLGKYTENNRWLPQIMKWQIARRVDIKEAIEPNVVWHRFITSATCDVFGKTVRRIRKERGMTQEQLSFLCGVKPSGLRLMETSHSKPSIELFGKLCKSLGHQDGTDYLSLLHTAVGFGDFTLSMINLPRLKRLAKRLLHHSEGVPVDIIRALANELILPKECRDEVVFPPHAKERDTFVKVKIIALPFPPECYPLSKSHQYAMAQQIELIRDGTLYVYLHHDVEVLRAHYQRLSMQKRLKRASTQLHKQVSWIVLPKEFISQYFGYSIIMLYDDSSWIGYHGRNFDRHNDALVQIEHSTLEGRVHLLSPWLQEIRVSMYEELVDQPTELDKTRDAIVLRALELSQFVRKHCNAVMVAPYN